MGGVDAKQGEGRLKVVCAWCGGVIRPAARPSKGMCQTCFARMMSEHSRANRPPAGRGQASDR